MNARFAWIGAAVAAMTLSGCSKSSPSEPEAPAGATEAAAVGEAVGSVTIKALVNGGPGAQADSPGQTFSTAACPAGGKVDLIYVRTYTPADDEVDTSALKAVFAQCSLSSPASSVNMTGELAMSGVYRGLSQPVNLRLTGSLNTSAGACAVDGTVVITGQFDGMSCGIQTRVNPQPRSPAALAALGTYSLTLLDGESLPRVVVTSPCTGYMNTGGLSLRDDGTFEITMFGSFVCKNGPGPNVSYAESGVWAMLDNGSVVFSTISPHLFKPSPGTISGSSIAMDLDVPSSAPDIPPTRMSATFTR